jgi:protein-S-isoprenylcysteine O-methyltransferase Ste14
MNLRDDLEDRGRWLFRHRSYLPLLLLPLFAAAVVQSASDQRGIWYWELSCLTFSFAGLAVRAGTVGFAPARTSGRNTATQVAAVLNTTGMYSIVRHPLYLGNAIIMTGVALRFRCWWLVAIVLLAFGLYYERIMLAEEAFLRERFGEAFETWSARVPAIVPNVHLWKAPGLTFSWKTVIRREYHGAVGILAAFAGLRYLGDLAIARPPLLDSVSAGYAALGALTFLICRFLAKRTTILRVEGR